MRTGLGPNRLITLDYGHNQKGGNYRNDQKKIFDINFVIFQKF